MSHIAPELYSKNIYEKPLRHGDMSKFSIGKTSQPENDIMI